PRRSRVLFLLALGIAAVWAAIGIRGHLFDLLFRFLPGLALFRVPARLQVFSAVALALMAGHGARAAAQLAIASRRARWRRRSWAGVGLAGLLTALPTLGIYAARFVAQPTPRLWKAFPRPYPDLDLVGLAAFTVAAVVIAGAVLAAGTRRLRWAPLWALPALVFAELFVAGSNTEQRHPLPDLIYRQPVTAQSLLPAGPGHRYLALLPAVPVPLPKTLASYRLTAADRAHFEFLLTWRSALRPNVGMGAAHLTADGYDGGILPLDGYVRFRKPLLPPASGNRPDFTDSTLTSTVWHPSWLGLTGTAVVLTARSADPNPPGCARCLVRARVLGNVAAWRPAGAARPTRAWLETGSGRVAARITSDEGERVTVAVPGAKGTLVLADAYYPGWTATADGRPVTIRKYAGFLRSVRVPAGTHTVTFQFRPARVIAGVAITLIALLAVLLLAIVPWHRLQAQRRSGPAQPPSDA
ncbi:MAG: YfhO family protein, partial [Candidatus Dormibacteraceae bacterium]